MGKRHGLALAELLVAIAVLAALSGLLLTACDGRLGAREESRRTSCRQHPSQLAKSMATYLNGHGDHRFYPCPLGLGAAANTFDGAEWLAGHLPLSRREREEEGPATP